MMSFAARHTCPRIASIVAGLMIWSGLGNAATLDDWPLPRHDSCNTCRSASDVPPPLELTWRVKPYQRLCPLTLESGGRLCVCRMDSTPETAVLDSTTGRTIRTFPGEFPVYLHGDILVATSGTPGGGPAGWTPTTVRAYDLVTGSPMWTRAWPGVSQSGVERDGRLYFTFNQTEGRTSRVGILVLDLESGAIVLSKLTPIPAVESDIATDGQALCFGASEWLYVLSAADPARGSKYFNLSGNGYLPMCDPPYVFAQGWANTAQCVDTRARRVLWSVNADRGKANCLACGADGRHLAIEARQNPNQLMALDEPTGNTAWTTPLLIADDAVCASAGGVVYAGGYHHPSGRQLPAGGFYAVDEHTGKVLWSFERPGVRGRTVCIGDGALFATDTSGWLYRFDRSPTPRQHR